MYAKAGCYYCERLEKLLESLKLQYGKIYPTNMDQVKKKTGMNTFPMVFIGNELIGGYTEFHTLYITGELEKKLIAQGIHLEDW